MMGRTPEAPLRWAVGSDGELGGAGLAQDLAALPDPLPAYDVLCVVLPGERVATRRLALPVRGERQLEAAARLAFEDVLAEPAAGFDLAWSEPDPQGKRLVSAAPRDWLETWMAALAPLDPDLVVVDHAALHADSYDGVVLRERGRIAACLPGGGFTGQEAFAGPLVRRLAGEASLLSVRIGPSGEQIGSESLVLADERALGAFYLTALGQETPPSFRRGRYQKRKERVGVSTWKLAGSLIAACLALWLVGDLFYGLRYAGAASDLRQQAEVRFVEAYPGTRILDLERQARARAQAPGGSTFLPLTAALTAALEEAGSVELQGLTYAQGGALVADLRYSDFGELERLTEALRARGVRAQEGSSPRREDGAYVDRLTLEASS
nr:type II secretion system protein GspL [Parvularcula dongshanensis]